MKGLRISRIPETVEVGKTEVVSELLQAVYRGDERAIERILAAEPELDLFEAAAVGDAEAVRDWVTHEHSAINAYSDDGFTALHLAAFFGHREVARLLLNNGADSEAISNNEMGARPLHSAAVSRDTGVAFLLIEHGAEVNSRQQGGWTPLHAAAHNGDVGLVSALVSAGAEVDAVDDQGLTPADLAREKGHDDVLALLG